MTLTVLCPTRDPGPRVRAILEPLRAVADEILVAADSRVDPAELGEHAAVADRLLRFELGPPNAALAWLHEQCRGDWVLTIAGDEVASAELVDALPELTSSREVLQVWLPTRWVFPDAAHWLAEWPWFPDFHNRLVRNDGTLRFPGVRHSHAAAALPARWIEAPLYHLDPVLRTTDERRAKVERNDRLTPGMTLPGGRPLNETYYLPELHARSEPAPIPDADRRQIERVLDAVPQGASAPAAGEPVPRTETARLWAGRELGAGGYRGRVAPFEPRRELKARPGELVSLHVRVSNEGDERWPWGLDAQPAVRLGYRVTGPGGEELPEGPRSPLGHELLPGEECIVPVVIQAPERAGEYTVAIDLVHDPVRWFGCALAVRLTVAG